MACYMCSVILMILFISYINANVIMQDTATKIQFPPSSVNASSISEKIADFTGSGLQKFKSGVTSFINNVSAAFNKTQGKNVLFQLFFFKSVLKTQFDYFVLLFITTFCLFIDAFL